jgi:hypothetical protein
MSAQYQYVKGWSSSVSHGTVMMRVLFLLFTTLVISTSAFAQLARVPQGHSILVDGRISMGEWTDAATIELGRGVQLLTKQHDDYVLLAVIFPKDSSGFVDLFISPDQSTIFDLHASAKLGERTTSTPDKWPDWVWWNNWAANVSRVESFFDKRSRLQRSASGTAALPLVFA